MEKINKLENIVGECHNTQFQMFNNGYCAFEGDYEKIECAYYNKGICHYEMGKCVPMIKLTLYKYRETD